MRPYKSTPLCLRRAWYLYATPFELHNSTPLYLSGAWIPHAAPLPTPFTLTRSPLHSFERSFKPSADPHRTLIPLQATYAKSLTYGKSLQTLAPAPAPLQTLIRPPYKPHIRSTKSGPPTQFSLGPRNHKPQLQSLAHLPIWPRNIFAQNQSIIGKNKT